MQSVVSLWIFKPMYILRTVSVILVHSLETFVELESLGLYVCRVCICACVYVCMCLCMWVCVYVCSDLIVAVKSLGKAVKSLPGEGVSLLLKSLPATWHFLLSRAIKQLLFWFCVFTSKFPLLLVTGSFSYTSPMNLQTLAKSAVLWAGIAGVCSLVGGGESSCV